MINYFRLMAEIQANPGKYLQREYNYTLVGDTVGAAVPTVTFNLPIDVAAPFVWCGTSYFASLAGVAQTDSSRVLPQVYLQLTDNGSNQPFFDRPQPLPNICGYQGLPQLLQVPYIFGAGSSVNAVFSNFSAAQDYSILRVSLIGYRVFELSGPAGVG
jgi:hypothetical protein